MRLLVLISIFLAGTHVHAGQAALGEASATTPASLGASLLMSRDSGADDEDDGTEGRKDQVPQ